ncbi:MAG: type II secretion system protein GspD, partial [Planctomycetota bacterium]
GIPLTNIDASLGGAVSGSGTENNPFSIFDVSVLDLGFNLNFTLQALAQKTNVRIMQEPRVFTADNQEAVFFDGQDIPFVTDSFTNNVGGLTQGFEYRQVGVILNVRPRITAERDVDMEVYLELSSMVPGVTLFCGAIVDRRSTTTEVVVKNGQTIVMSGILTDRENKIERKIPFFGDLPVLGNLFKSWEDGLQTSELIAFVTPSVVDNPSENDSNFNAEDRRRLQELLRPMNELREEGAREYLQERLVNPGSSKPARMIDPDRDEDPEPDAESGDGLD